MERADCSRFLGQGECCYYCHEEGHLISGLIIGTGNVTICQCLAADMGLAASPLHTIREAHIFPDQPEIDP